MLSVDISQTRGSVRMNADGSLTYDPAAGFAALGPGETATDTFTYVVDDFVGGRGIGVVTVTVGGVANPHVSSQELLQSFEVGPLPNPSWDFSGRSEPARGWMFRRKRVRSFYPTHLATMLQLEALDRMLRRSSAICPTT